MTGKAPYTLSTVDWAETIGITPGYASKLAKAGRIKYGKEGESGAQRQDRDWFVRPGSFYEYKSLGGPRKNAGRPKQ